jgi:hypothetical protein
MPTHCDTLNEFPIHFSSSFLVQLHWPHYPQLAYLCSASTSTITLSTNSIGGRSRGNVRLASHTKHSPWISADTFPKKKIEFEILRWLQWSHVKQVEFKVEENGDVVKQLKQIKQSKATRKKRNTKKLGFYGREVDIK